MQINRETQDFASLLFLQHKFKSTFLTITSQHASLVVTVFCNMYYSGGKATYHTP